MQSGDYDELREQGSCDLREGRFADAAAHFEAAALCASSFAAAAMARIHRASVDVILGLSSRNVSELPELVLRRDSPQQRFLASYYLAMFLVGRRQIARADRYLQIAFESAGEIDDPYYVASAYDIASELAMARGAFDVSHDHVVRAAEMLAGCELSEQVTMARACMAHNIGYALLARGAYAEAVVALRRGVAALEAAGAGPNLAPPYVNLALAQLMIDDCEGSEAHLAAFEAHVMPHTEWLRRYAYYLRGEIAQRRGRYAEARREYGRLREYYPEFAHLVDVLSGVSLLPLLLPERN